MRHYGQAVKLDPKCGAAYDMLAISAEEKGDLVGSWHGEKIDRALEIGMEMAQRFPDEAASIISYLGTRARTTEKARAIYELLHDKFTKASVGTPPALFSIDLKADRARALAVAQEMVKLSPENKIWPLLVTCAQAVIDSDGLIYF